MQLRIEGVSKLKSPDPHFPIECKLLITYIIQRSLKERWYKTK